MTLAIATISSNCVWVCVDRRLTRRDGRYADDGTKLFRLEVEDAFGIMTYAGVGARIWPERLEVSEWLARLLRGRRYNLDGAIEALRHAASNEEFHKLGPGHVFAFAGFKDGSPRIEIVANIDLVRGPGGQMPQIIPFQRATLTLAYRTQI